MQIKESGKPIVKTENLVIQELANELLIYDLDNHKAFCLNQTSMLVWQNCDGDKGISEIASEMSRRLNQPVKGEVVWLALEDFKKEGLLKFETETPDGLEGLNRRQVIRKIGLASLVTLPIISGLIAPTAVSAQTCVPGGLPNDAPCTASSECQSCCCKRDNTGNLAQCKPGAGACI